MRILSIVPSAAFSLLLAGATCVANVAQKGPEGPWVGEVVNVGDQTIHDAAVQGHIYDADGRDLHGQVGVLACPSNLLPGERGAFQLFEGDPDYVDLPGAPAQSKLPLRAELGPSEDLYVGSGAVSGNGLLVREIARDLPNKRVRIVLRNNSTARYFEPSVCAVLRDGRGKLLEVARVDGPRLPESLAPGNAITLELRFASLTDGQLRFHVKSTSEAPFEDCCPPNGPSTWSSVKNQNFSVLLPPGWAYEPLQGIDSFVGRYYGDGVELTFDYGIYSDPLNYGDDPAYTVHEETIGGLTAKTVRPEGLQGLTGVHFADIDVRTFPSGDRVFVRLTITGQDLTPAQQAIALQIFRSIRFVQ